MYLFNLQFAIFVIYKLSHLLLLFNCFGWIEIIRNQNFDLKKVKDLLPEHKKDRWRQNI